MLMNILIEYPGYYNDDGTYFQPFKAVAAADYDGNVDYEEMSLISGERVWVVMLDVSGWWMVMEEGNNHEKWGWAPRTWFTWDESEGIFSFCFIPVLF